MFKVIFALFLAGQMFGTVTVVDRFDDEPTCDAVANDKDRTEFVRAHVKSQTGVDVDVIGACLPVED